MEGILYEASNLDLMSALILIGIALVIGIVWKTVTKIDTI